METDSLIRALQGSIAPCVYISGVGLLLLCMTNRLGRTTDRIRLLCKDLKDSSVQNKNSLKKQIDILYRRCQFLRIAIALAAVSIFFVSIIILMLFSTYVLSLSLGIFIQFLFTSSLMCLIVSLIFFLFDIALTLKTIKIEIDQAVSF